MVLFVSWESSTGLSQTRNVGEFLSLSIKTPAMPPSDRARKEEKHPEILQITT